MNIIPVPSLILLQLVPFLLTASILYFVLFKPMLRYLDERDEKIAGAKEKAIAMQKESAINLADLKEKTKAMRMEITSLRSEERAKVMSEYNDTIYSARKEADKGIKEKAMKILDEQVLAREELKKNARDIANMIASQTLGRSISG
jgi:F-type H+-transporting ATPase subunit b